MSTAPEFLQALAESLSPLSHSLAAGLLLRPVAACDDQEGPAAPHALYSDLGDRLAESVPALLAAILALREGALDELDEIVEDLAGPALDLIDMSRRIWQAPLPAEAEAARPLLATIAEAPVASLLQWILEIMHTAIDPWAVAEDPDSLTVPLPPEVADEPVREALALWRKAHPGALPEAPLP